MAPRIAAIAALGLLAAGLAGCAHQKPGLDGYRWAYLTDGGEAPRLAYGRPNSDDVLVMLSCLPGRDLIDVSAVGLTGGEIVLTSGRAETRLPAATVEDVMTAGSLLEGRGKASAPALAAFRASGELSLLAKGERHDLAAGSADRGQVRAFFNACGA